MRDKFYSYFFDEKKSERKISDHLSEKGRIESSTPSPFPSDEYLESLDNKLKALKIIAISLGEDIKLGKVDEDEAFGRIHEILGELGKIEGVLSSLESKEDSHLSSISRAK